MEKQDMTEISKLEQGEESKGEVTKSTKDNSTSPSDSKSTEITLTASQLQTLDYNDFSTPARMMELGKILIQSKLVTGKTKEDIVVSLMAGRELGLPLVVSLSQIYPIDGKPSLGIHIIRGIILKNNILFKKLDDSAELRQYAYKNGDKLEIIGTMTAREAPKDAVRGKAVLGYKTTYEFSREIRMPSGKYQMLTTQGSFTSIEAVEAELKNKTNWKRYWRRMLDARAFAIGAREIADDLINGMLTPDELGANSYINDDGIETVQYENVE